MGRYSRSTVYTEQFYLFSSHCNFVFSRSVLMDRGVFVLAGRCAGGDYFQVDSVSDFVHTPATKRNILHELLRREHLNLRNSRNSHKFFRSMKFADKTTDKIFESTNFANRTSHKIFLYTIFAGKTCHIFFESTNSADKASNKIFLSTKFPTKLATKFFNLRNLREKKKPQNFSVDEICEQN